MATATELRAQVLRKAAEDASFRARLIEEPKAVLASEFGIEIPGEYEIVVLEDDVNTTHLVLPPTSQLSEAELALVSGGTHDQRGTWDF